MFLNKGEEDMFNKYVLVLNLLKTEQHMENGIHKEDTIKILMGETCAKMGNANFKPGSDTKPG